MPEPAHAPERSVIIVGLPEQIRGRLESRLGSRILLNGIRIAREGGFRLEPRPEAAVEMLWRFCSEFPEIGKVTVLALPYANLPPLVAEALRELEETGVAVVRVKSGEGIWPARPPRLDQTFLDALLAALRKEIEPPPDERENEVSFELLRGLASHSKMGPNNHSHEDDLWKSRGADLGPGDKKRIIASLLNGGILGRKKNKSKGGTGWVYWIDDVAKAESMFPGLAPYFRKSS